MSSTMPMSQQMTFRVRYVECDPMGYLHHSVYWVYFEAGRTELLRAQGFTYRDMTATGEFFVMARGEIKFRKPARYDDLLTLHTIIDRVTRARIDHRYELYRDDLLLCTATSTLACVNNAGELIAIPEQFSPH
ncbi:MAG: putative esterase [Phycisphaerae bacterium]|nr:putative esterase [Phycisphaerae bacterium]